MEKRAHTHTDLLSRSLALSAPTYHKGQGRTFRPSPGLPGGLSSLPVAAGAGETPLTAFPRAANVPSGAKGAYSGVAIPSFIFYLKGTHGEICSCTFSD